MRRRATTHRRPEPPRRRREAGFTLVELAVATLVLLFAVLLACDLLAESGRLLGHSARRARDPYPLLAAELLRNDLRGAAPPAPGMSGMWEHGPLQLQTQEGLVIWQRDAAGRLARRVVGGNPRAYLQDVRSFRWRLLSGNAVEVWARYHVSSPYLRQLAGSLPRADPGEDQDLHLLVVARAGGWAPAW